MDCPAYGVSAPSHIRSSHTVNKSVTELKKMLLAFFFQNGRLEIRELAPMDEAMYSCIVINSVGKDTTIILCVIELAYKFVSSKNYN